jgi:hypothetical protein
MSVLILKLYLERLLLNKMFENYLEDIAVYLKLEKHFADFFKLKLNELNKSKDLYTMPFYKTTYGNGAPFMDGNPIFSVKNELKKTLLRVIIDDDTGKLTSTDEKCEFGKERVVVGNIFMLKEMQAEICKWLEEQ